MDTILTGLTGFSSTLVQDVIERIKSFLLDTATQVLQFDEADERRKLEEELLSEVYRSLESLTTVKAWQQWADKVFTICYDIEDLLDDLEHNTSNTSLFGTVKSLKRKRSTIEAIQEVQDRLRHIWKNIKFMKQKQQQEQQCQCCAKKVTAAVSDKLLGREEEKEQVIRLLLNDSIRSVNIVGMGGLGKTTLARHFQCDSRIQDKFDHIRWVSVSAEFDLKTVAEIILQKSLESPCTFLHDRIRDFFEELYEGKSVLIMLDDLWDITDDDWRFFKSLFQITCLWKVLVTTRNPFLTWKTEATHYDLPLMRDEDCQALVMERVSSLTNIHLGLSNPECRRFKENVRVIAQMSKGLPVAANALGLSLSHKLSEGEDCRSLLETDVNEMILPALKLNIVGSPLERCLAYCTLFPCHHSFKKDNLIELWMAEGFVRPQNKTKLRQYFDGLCQRSFFQRSQLDKDGVLSYKMHDFIHRFAATVAPGICVRLEDNGSCSDRWYEKARHLSFLITCNVKLNLEKIENCEGLRTFIVPNGGVHIKEIPYSFFQKLNRLRVLDLSHTNLDVLQGSLGNLKLLRHLDLSKTFIESLPASISNLQLLQVLKLRGCDKLFELPSNLHTLTRLTHLDVDIQGLLCMPASIGCLTDLQTLPKFFVGNGEGYCITELRNLKSLCGTLSLVNLENVKDWKEARGAKLREKRLLRRLELEWSPNSSNKSTAIDVFAGLEPHEDVKELKVTHYVGFSFPTWLASQSCTLVSIEVKDCLLDDVLPALGQLPLLKNLHLEGMHRVTHMRNPVCEDGSGEAFPSLKSLEINNMMCLTHWLAFPDKCMLKLNKLTITECPSLSSVQSLNPISSLQTLEIDQCPALEALPQLPASVQSLIIIKSDKMKQRCVPQGPEWDRIYSIPWVVIDNIRIVFPET